MSETNTIDDIGKLVLRISVAGLMLFHGIAKVLNTGSLAYIGGKLSAIGLPSFISYGVYIGEVIAPVLIIIGLYTRLGGVVIVINMLFAIGLSHSGDILALTKHGGWAIELQMFYLLGAVCIVLLGSGRYAVKKD